MNLFICNTTFQMYFLLKIIEYKKIKNYDIIFIGNKNNEKNIHYFKKVSESANKSIILNCDIKTILFPFEINKIECLNYDSIYLSSIDSIYTQLILSKLKFNNLYTFDDGTANINPQSSYYIDNRNVRMRTVSFLLRNRYNIKKIKKLSNTHYSIYNKKNIIDSVVNIDLFNKINNNNNNNNGKVCNLILGSVYAAILSDPNMKNILFDKLKDRFKKLNGDTIYLPHPRDLEIIKQFKNEYIRTDLIFEDFYSQLSEKYEVINIFSFSSSSILNLDLKACYIITGNIFNQTYLNLVKSISTHSSNFIEIHI